jgi:D-hexose-6-phosphate mutarotase
MDDLELIRIKNPAGEAVIALQGAQLLTWQPAGEAPVV